jgi:hypothetical protein
MKKPQRSTSRDILGNEYSLFAWLEGCVGQSYYPPGISSGSETPDRRNDKCVQ